MSLSKREKRLLILAVIIIVFVSIAKWVIVPFYDHYQALDYRIQQREVLLKKCIPKLEHNRKIKEKLTKKKIELSKLNKLIFSGNKDKKQVEFLNIIDKKIQESGLELQSKTIDSVPIVDQKNLIQFFYYQDQLYLLF